MSLSAKVSYQFSFLRNIRRKKEKEIRKDPESFQCTESFEQVRQVPYPQAMEEATNDAGAGILREARKVFLEHDTHTLCRKGLFQVLIHVVSVIVSLQANLAASGQLIFQVKLADNSILLGWVVLIPEVTVKDEPVVKRLTRKQHLDFSICNAILTGTNVVPICTLSVILFSKLEI